MATVDPLVLQHLDDIHPAAAKFLKSLPEWQKNIKVLPINGQPEVCLSAAFTKLFATWAERNGYASPHKAESVIKFVTDREKK